MRLSQILNAVKYPNPVPFNELAVGSNASLGLWSLCKLTALFSFRNTRVNANMYAVHFDEKTFPEPEKFKPERFVSSDGKLTGVENLMPFNVGE